MKQILIAVAATATLALAGCGSTSTTTSSSAAPSPSGDGGASSPSGGLSTRAGSLGTIVVDTAGHTVYRYDADTQGASHSACTGGCASAWPAVPAGSVSGSGVTGKIGSITGVGGKPQATLDGWPLYYYAGDSAAGDTTGQGVGGVWWVVAPAGAEITAAPSPAAGSSAASARSGGHGY